MFATGSALDFARLRLIQRVASRLCAVGTRLGGLLLAGVALFGCAGRTPVAADRPPVVELSGPSLSPDGSAILFAFKYGRSPYKLALASTAPVDTSVTILAVPSSLDWQQVVWAPDGRHVAAISHCDAANCYEGATGYNVWRFRLCPSLTRPQRLTTNDANRSRSFPFFGRSADEVYWVLRGIRRTGRFLRVQGERFIARFDGEREAIVFPDDPVFRPDGRISSAKARFYGLRPAEGFSADGLYFVARAIGGPPRMPPATLAAAQAAADANKSHDAFLFRWRGGDALELVQDFPVGAIDAQNAGNGYVVETRVPPGFHSSPVEFHVARDGVSERRLRIELVGTVFNVSASERLDTIVFDTQRVSGEQTRFWVHREGMSEPVNLNIAERVRREVEREATLKPEQLRITPATRRPAAAPR